MAKISWKGSALLAPLPPVMVTCGVGECANIITVAWTGIINTHPPRLSISVRPTRHSYGLIKESGEFVVNLTPARLAWAADYCGIYTGAKVNKFEKAGLTPEPSDVVACPGIAECPLSLECRVIDILPQGTHDLFLADIVAVRVDDSLIDESGRLDLSRAALCAFGHGEYYALGETIGRFGFSTAKKPPTPKSPRKPTPTTAQASAPTPKKVAGKHAPVPHAKAAHTAKPRPASHEPTRPPKKGSTGHSPKGGRT